MPGHVVICRCGWAGTAEMCPRGIISGLLDHHERAHGPVVAGTREWVLMKTWLDGVKEVPR